jgi:hypothetical protein
MTDPLQRLERTIKVIVAMISLVGIAFIGLRIYASRARIGLPNPRKDCEAVGRVYDTTRATCLPPRQRRPATRP